MPIEYVLERPSPEPVAAPRLDASQQAVVDHPGGPLLVLAGPGTGKTTTLIEAVVDRIDNRGLKPEEALVLTFSRKAADELKSRIAGRLGRTTSTTPAMTFHSFCYALVREFQAPESYGNPLRLLSAPEQDAMIQELVAGTEAASWPKGLQPALRTRGFARELQVIMSRARSLGMDADGVADAGVLTRRDDWVATGRFFDEYVGVSAFANTVDYSDLVFQALQIAQSPEHQDALRRRFRFVVVDEYQDTDPLQVQLLQAIAGDGHDLIAVGDPDQSIYAFRGADVTGILNFPKQFAGAGGPAPVLALGATRRFGSNILAASRAIIGKIGVAGHLDREAFEGFRNISSLAGDPGEVIVQTFASPAAEAEHLALFLREAHVREGMPWSDMAVLVRSGRASLPRLQRALTAAGIPVEVAGDEVPLAAEPAVRSLLSALRVAEAISEGRVVPNDQAEAALTGPLGQLDAPALRRLGRALRAAAKAAGDEVRPSAELLAASLSDPVSLRLGGHPDNATSSAAKRAHKLAVLLREAADQIAARAAPEQVLWTLWSGTDWGKRLFADFESGGEGSGRADQDLDALCALFSRAARAEEQQQRQTIGNFVTELEAQQIPADTLADRGARGAAVRLMTAHRSKGLEWPLVVVAGVQDGAWPDVRYRGTLLQSERLATGGQQHPVSPAALLAEERRLFYVACTRASRRLVVTAVESISETGDQPSRFLIEIEPFAADPPEVINGMRVARPLPRPTRPLSLRGAIAGLRALIEQTDSPAVRAGAATQIARLAQVDSAATRGAHPDRWWGVLDITDNQTPIVKPDEPLGLSASAVSKIIDCPLSWFLDREARGGAGTSTAQGFGSIVHAIAADVIDSGIAADPVVLESHLDKVWSQLPYAAPWISARERVAAREAIERFANWHTGNCRTPLAAEHNFSVELEIEGGTVVLRGSMDRVEIAQDGRVHVVDLKTSKNATPPKDIAAHSQLGFYQLVVERGGVDDLAPGAAPGGAELVQLRNPAGAKVPDHPKVQPQDPPRPGEPFFATEELLQAVRAVRDERFPATPSDKICGYCDFRRVCPAQPEGATILDKAKA
ncbi:MAG: ATP-dependent helicase [Actinomycetota bacterium]|nr:ATP-dependent helicase [Actinomycetota bacterium]